MKNEFVIFEPLVYSLKTRFRVGIGWVFGLFFFFFYGLQNFENRVLFWILFSLGVVSFLYVYYFVLNKFIERGVLFLDDKGLHVKEDESFLLEYGSIKEIKCYYYYATNKFGFYHELQYAIELVIETSTKESYNLICKVISANGSNLVEHLKSKNSEEVMRVTFYDYMLKALKNPNLDDTLIDDGLIRNN